MAAPSSTSFYDFGPAITGQADNFTKQLNFNFDNLGGVLVGQIPGTTTNDDAAAGNVGEYLESVVSTPLALPRFAPVPLTSRSFTAGDWNIWGAATFQGQTNDVTVGLIAASIGSGAGVILTTNSGTAAGNNTLHFASVPATVIAGMTITDNTSQTVIPANTTVVSTTATTVVMNQNAAGAGVGSGDSIIITSDLDGSNISELTGNNSKMFQSANIPTCTPPLKRFSFASTTTIYLMVYAGYTADAANPSSKVTCFGAIRGRRAR